MLLRKQPSPFPYSFTPVISQQYRPGQVSGVRSADLSFDLGGGGSITMAEYLAAVEASWVLVPSAVRAHLASGDGDGPRAARQRPLRACFFNPADDAARFAAQSSYGGGLYLSADSTKPFNNTTTVANPPMLRRRTYDAAGAVLDAGTRLHASHLHELGHAVDFTWLGNLPDGGDAGNLTSASLWGGLAARALALGVPWSPPVGDNPSYGFTNAREWFAEVWTCRVLGQTDGAVATWDDAAGGRYRASLLLFLCGGDQALHADVLAAFNATFPTLKPYVSKLEPGFDLAAVSVHRAYDAAAVKADWEAQALVRGAAIGRYRTITAPDLIRSAVVLSGQLPTGLTLQGAAAGYWPSLGLAGTPTTAGTFTATIRLTGHPSVPATDFSVTLTVTG